MNDRKMLTAKEVGLRIKERRNELKISMPELGRRVGVNKSTIQRYETDGVNPTRSMVINGLAEALLVGFDNVGGHTLLIFCLCGGDFCKSPWWAAP